MPLQFPFFNTIARKMWSAVTLPVEVGATGASGDTTAPQAGTGLLGLALLSGGGLLGAGLLLFDRRPAGWRLRSLLRLLRPNPHRAALRAAAQGGNLAALRRAARAYADHERAAGRAVDEAALAGLDRAIFGPPATGQGFDAAGFVAALTSGGGNRPS